MEKWPTEESLLIYCEHLLGLEESKKSRDVFRNREIWKNDNILIECMNQEMNVPMFSDFAIFS